MNIKNYAEQNQEAWNEAAGVHRKSRKIDYKEAFKDKKFSVLDNVLTSLLEKIPLQRKKVAQLCCNNGRELLSIVNTMDAIGIGFDISDEFIAEAKIIAQSAKLDCSFVRIDINKITNRYDSKFDLVLLTAGALTWFHDLGRLFNVVSRLLKIEGYLLIYEIHPFTNLIAWQGESEYDISNPYKIIYKYFRNTPWINNDGADYIGKTTYKSKTFVSFAHKLSDIITAISVNNIIIKEFKEYPHDVSGHLDYLEQDRILPFSYTMIGQKKKRGDGSLFDGKNRINTI